MGFCYVSETGATLHQDIAIKFANGSTAWSDKSVIECPSPKLSKDEPYRRQSVRHHYWQFDNIATSDCAGIHRECNRPRFLRWDDTRTFPACVGTASRRRRWGGRFHTLRRHARSR